MFHDCLTINLFLTYIQKFFVQANEHGNFYGKKLLSCMKEITEIKVKYSVCSAKLCKLI